MTYAQAYERSLRDPEGYWADAAGAIDWDRPFDRVLNAERAPFVRWFEGGRLNTCFNAVDRHVARGRGEHTALIYHSAIVGTVQSFTYRALRDQVARTAGMLRAHGVSKGDRIVIYMPMVPEAVFAMLACARLGAVHSVVFGGFAAPELAKRIDDCEPKLVVAASCGLEPGRVVEYVPLLERALSVARHKVDQCIVLQRAQCLAELPGDYLDWNVEFERAEPVDCVAVEATDPLYILYTSGTTGVSKGVVRDNGGHAVALAQSMEQVYGLAPGQVFWAASDIGWVVGHSYIVYAPLLRGATTVLFEGKPVATPDAGVFWRVIAQHGVDVLFAAPTALRAIKREDPQGAFIGQSGVGKLGALFLAGERADPDTVRWAEQRLKIPVIDHWWQTELGWPAIAACRGLGQMQTRYGSAGRPVPGFAFEVLTETHTPTPKGAIGDIVIRLPLPPGCLQTLWRNDVGFECSYLEPHPGFYTTGDAGMIDEDDFIHVMSRIDDLINVAGHRLSTGGIEQVIASHPDVAECAVIGVADSLKGEVPMGLIVLKAGVARTAKAVAEDVVRKVRDELGPVAAFKQALVVDKLPKTRSGKVLRGTIRGIANGDVIAAPATIEDTAALDVVRAALRGAGYNSPA